MSFGFFGIQFGFALQNANVSRIFETLGAKIDLIPILWVAAPVTGLIVQPIIGHMSDNTWNKLGRRRPYFLVGAILASIALLVMPNSPILWFAAGMLWIMDASINISMEPFRAFVGDMLTNEQRTRGFAMQSFFIGTGAVIASILPWVITNIFKISNIAENKNQIPPHVKFAFYIGGTIFLLAVLWTVISTKEYSPDELKSFEEEETNSENKIDKQNKHNLNNKEIKYLRNFIFWILAGGIFTWLIARNNWDKELYILGGGLIVFGIIQFFTGFLKNMGLSNNGFVEVIEDMFHMPKTMAQLAIVQFFSWFALFAMWIYTTSAVTSHIFGSSDTSSKLYNDGADWVGVLFAVYNGFAALVAFLLPVIAKLTNRRITHLISLVLGGLGLASFYLIRDPNILIISMFGVGFAWASILSMPYAMLTSALPQNKMGVYMGIFNFFIVIPQILAASILGFFVRNLFAGQSIYALVLGGGSLIIAGILTLFVQDKYDH